MTTRVEPAGKKDVCRRVLVVEDERTISEVVSRYLERAGYETRQAFTGPAAVGVANSWNPDLSSLT